MAWRLDDAKPLPEPMLTYCQLDSYKETSVKFETTTRFNNENACEKVEFNMSANLSEPELMNRTVVTSFISCRCNI